MTTLYISGPMTATGRDDLNFPAFHAAAETLRDAGYTVINPAENWGGITRIPRELCMRLDIQQVLLADGIATLDDWWESPGARLEVDIAEAVGIDWQSVGVWADKSGPWRHG